jgi:hypothetical protein
VIKEDGTILFEKWEGDMQSPSSARAVLLREESLDADGDGMSNDWEALYGLNDGVDSGPNDDKDGDGLSNLEEYLLGRNPTVFDTVIEDSTGAHVKLEVFTPLDAVE